MPSVTRLNGQSYFITTVLIPTELYTRARDLDINFSQTLRQALTKKVETEGPLP